MKNDFNKYGRKLTEKEFLNAVSAGYNAHAPTRAGEALRRRAETSLMIDHLIGVDYPQDKREILHRARERATRKFIYSPATLCKAAFVAAAQKAGVIRGIPGLDDGSFNLAGRIMGREFAKEKELDTDDIISFLGRDAAPFVLYYRHRKP